MAKGIEVDKLYSFPEAAQVLNVRLPFIERWIGQAIARKEVIDYGEDGSPMVIGSDLARITRKLWSQLESEHSWYAFERAREAEAKEREVA